MVVTGGQAQLAPHARAPTSAAPSLFAGIDRIERGNAARKLEREEQRDVSNDHLPPGLAVRHDT